MQQRPGGDFPPAVQRGQPGTGLVVHRPLIAVRVHSPSLFPEAAGDTPSQHIILQPVAGVPVQRAEGRAEEGEHFLGLHAAGGALQGRQHGPQGRFPQNVLPAGIVGRNAAALQQRPQQRDIQRPVGAGHGDVAAAEAGHHQAAQLRCGHGALLVRRGTVSENDGLRLRRGRIPICKEMVAEEGGVGSSFLRQRMDFGSTLSGSAEKMSGRLPGGVKDGRAAPDIVAGRRRRHGPVKLQQTAQNVHLQSRVVGESVEVKGLVRRVVGLPQEVPQPFQLIGRVRPAHGTDGVVALEDQPKLLQFLGKGSLKAPGGGQQVRSADTVVFEFLDLGRQPDDQLRLCSGRRVDLEPGQGLLQRQGQGREPATIVQGLPADAAVD